MMHGSPLDFFKEVCLIDATICYNQSSMKRGAWAGKMIGVMKGIGMEFKAADATINGAFIAMGLVFGENDMEKTIEVAIRCGQDTDCNAANAAALLGIIQGYDAIDENLKSHIPEMGDKLFLYTDISFNKAVSLTQSFAEENILANGGSHGLHRW